MSTDAPAPDFGPDSGPNSAGLMRRTDTTKAHPARVYDVFLGGTDNFPADREATAMALAANPRGHLDVRHNRDFVRRAVTELTTRAGQIVQDIAPESRIVYADHDPVVLVHAQALLTSSTEGGTDYVEADLRDPAKILLEARRTLDLDRPVALVLAAVLHFIEDDEAYDIVRNLLDALPSGSHLVLSHLSEDMNPVAINKVAETFRERGFSFVLRSRAGIERFLTENGLEQLEPGIVPAHHWRPDDAADAAEAPEPAPSAEHLAGLDAIGRTRYMSIGEATDDDINVYVTVARKG